MRFLFIHVCLCIHVYAMFWERERARCYGLRITNWADDVNRNIPTLQGVFGQLSVGCRNSSRDWHSSVLRVDLYCFYMSCCDLAPSRFWNYSMPEVVLFLNGLSIGPWKVKKWIWASHKVNLPPTGFTGWLFVACQEESRCHVFPRLPPWFKQTWRSQGSQCCNGAQVDESWSWVVATDCVTWTGSLSHCDGGFCAPLDEAMHWLIIYSSDTRGYKGSLWRMKADDFHIDSSRLTLRELGDLGSPGARGDKLRVIHKLWPPRIQKRPKTRNELMVM